MTITKNQLMQRILWKMLGAFLSKKLFLLFKNDLPQMHLWQPNWCLATSLIRGLRSIQMAYYYLMSKIVQHNRCQNRRRRHRLQIQMHFHD